MSNLKHSSGEELPKRSSNFERGNQVKKRRENFKRKRRFSSSIESLMLICLLIQMLLLCNLVANSQAFSQLETNLGFYLDLGEGDSYDQQQQQQRLIRRFTVDEDVSSSSSSSPGNDNDNDNSNDQSATTPSSNEELIIDNDNNSTTNSSDIDSTRNRKDKLNEERFLVSLIIANIIIFIIGICGNFVVILIILKYTRSPTVTDIYILNLAFADLMYTTSIIPLITTMRLEHWMFGEFMCRIYMAATFLNQYASSLLLVVMSFDRFLAVCHPIYAQKFRQIKRAKMICLGIWATCFLLGLPLMRYSDLSDENVCGPTWPVNNTINVEKFFTVFAFVIGFAGPMVLLIGFYICVIRKLRLAAQVSARSIRTTKNRENTARRIEHLVIGIICTYFVCWLPYWIIQIINTIELPLNDTVGKVLFYSFNLSSTLGYTNSALNPILYAFLSDNFKRRCSEIFRTIGSFRSPSANNTNNNTNQNNPSSTNNNNQNPQSRIRSCSVYRAESKVAQPALAGGSANNNNNETLTLVPSPFMNTEEDELGEGNRELSSNDLIVDGGGNGNANTKKRSVVFAASDDPKNNQVTILTNNTKLSDQVI